MYDIGSVPGDGSATQHRTRDANGISLLPLDEEALLYYNNRGSSILRRGKCRRTASFASPGYCHPNHGKDNFMKFRVLISAAVVAFAALPVAAQAQGVPGGVAHGAYEGNRRAGPVGAVVGAAVGGVIGGIEGVLGTDRVYYQPGYDAPPPRVYRHRRLTRTHIRHRVRRHVRSRG